MQRILIVRLSAIGDVVHGLPVACALRQARPDAHISWLVEGRTAQLLAGHPAIDEVIQVPRGWLKNWGEVTKLRRRLRHAAFDATLDLQGLSKSAIAAWLSGAKTRIGFGGKDGREISTWLNTTLIEPTATHVIDRNLQLLAALHVVPGAAQFNLPEHAAQATMAGALLGRLEARGPIIVMNPGAGWPSKRWPLERFAETAARLGACRGAVSLVVWGGAHEEAVARQIVAAAGGHARLAPATSLIELTAIARRADVFLAADTGPLHLAAAVGAPCVGLFGPMPAERNGPYGAGHIALQEVRMTGSSRQRRTAGNESMTAISVDIVTAACEQQLDCRQFRAA